VARAFVPRRGFPGIHPGGKLASPNAQQSEKNTGLSPKKQTVTAEQYMTHRLTHSSSTTFQLNLYLDLVGKFSGSKFFLFATSYLVGVFMPNLIVDF
jgi:hypothetical protein